MIDESIQKMLATLGYSEVWLDSGILSSITLSEQFQEFNLGGDENKEHYRYRTLSNHLRSKVFFDEKDIQYVLQILNDDADKSMAASATLLLLKNKSLTDWQFKKIADFLKVTFGDNMCRYVEKIKREKE